MQRLCLKILDTIFRVESDSKFRAFLHRLWEPFSETGGGPSPVEVTISETPDGWRLEIADEDPFEAPDAWILANELRYRLVNRAAGEKADLLSLHAAVVARDSHALLLIGAFGAGKTTLTLGLLERGWIFLSDDVALLEAGSRLVRPFPKPLGIKRNEEWARLGRYWSDVDWPHPPIGAFQLPPSSLSPVAEDPVEARWLVFPAFSPSARLACEEISRAKALTLAAQNAHPQGVEVLREIRGLCEQTTPLRLSYSESGPAIDLLERTLLGAMREGPMQEAGNDLRFSS